MNLNPDLLAPTSKFHRFTFMAIGHNPLGTIYSNGTYRVEKCQPVGTKKPRWFVRTEKDNGLVTSDARFAGARFKAAVHADLLRNWSEAEAYERLNAPGIHGAEAVLAAYRKEA